MEKVQAWLKAHWKEALIGAVAISAVVWFLFLRRGSTSQPAGVTRPAGGGGGGSSPASSDSGSNPLSAIATGVQKTFATLIGYTGSGVTTNPNTVNLFKNAGDKLFALTVPAGTDVQVVGPAVPVSYPDYPDLTSMSPILYQGQQYFTFTSEVSGASPVAAPRPISALQAASKSGIGMALRGSGFRGGDVYPAAGGDSRPIHERAATAGNLPAAPLGTPMRAKQPMAMDVRRAPRRETAIAEVSRGAIPLPQSFSVPIREHLERQRPVLTVKAVDPIVATAAGGGDVSSPAASGVEQASSTQKATAPAPMALASPNIARGRKRYGPMRPPKQARGVRF